MKRPLSVWVTLALLTVACIIATPATLFWTVSMFSSLRGNNNPPLEILLLIAEFAIRLSLLGFLTISVAAIFKCSPRSRSLGLMALLLVFVLVLMSKLWTTLHAPVFQYNSPAEKGGAFIVDVLLFIGFWILWFRYGFSKKSRLYFGQTQPPA
jgi:hypothetical protein